MRHAAEAGVEADLAHLVGARQEEVDHAVCDHAAWETHELVVEAAPLPEAVPAAWCTRLHTQHLTVGGGEARNFSHRAPHQVQWRPLQYVHKPLQPRPRSEDEVIVHPQHILGGYLGHCQVTACEPTLAKWHEIVLDVGTANDFWLVAVVGDDHSDGWIEAADAGDECPQPIVTKERLSGNGDQSADVVLG